MIPVKTYPKFKCDFCKKRAVKSAMEKHERICYLNPSRECRQMARGGYIWLKGDHDSDCLDCIKSKDAIEMEEEKSKIHYPDAVELYEGV